jgi:hypothetical protein
MISSFPSVADVQPAILTHDSLGQRMTWLYPSFFQRINNELNQLSNAVDSFRSGESSAVSLTDQTDPLF